MGTEIETDNLPATVEPTDGFSKHPVQREMPFAIVEGEPITQLPVDLYIPPQALEVFLEAFEGPLDLLLYLIKRQNIDILDIPIADVTRQYTQYIDLMQELQLELVGEYLVMAAMLAEIKSRMLLPRQAAQDGDDEEDPRAELVRRLQQYEVFRTAAQDLDALPRLERDVIVAEGFVTERRVIQKLPDITLKEIMIAFRDVIQRAEMYAHHHVQRERFSVRKRMADVMDRLRNVDFMEFTALFDPREGRMGVVVTLIAILELIREAIIEIVQTEAFGPIHVKSTGLAAELPTEVSTAADEEGPFEQAEQTGVKNEQ